MTRARDLRDRCRSSFPNTVWTKGQWCFDHGRVELLRADSEGLDASVKGTGGASHQVSLAWSGASQFKALFASCTCPEYGRGQRCMHIVAVILEADAYDLGLGIRGTGALRVIRADDVWEADHIRETEPGDELMEVGPEDNGSESKTGPGRRRSRKKRGSESPAWRGQLSAIRRAGEADADERQVTVRPVWKRVVYYLLDFESMYRSGLFSLDFFQRAVKKRGGLGKLKPLRLSKRNIETLSDAADRELMSILLGAAAADEPYGFFGYTGQMHGHCEVPAELHSIVLPRLCATGRFGCLSEEGGFEALAWDAGPPWHFKVQVVRDLSGERWRLLGLLDRERPGFDRATVAIEEPYLLLSSGLVMFEDRLAAADYDDHFQWIAQMRQSGPIEFAVGEEDTFLAELAGVGGLPRLELPEEIGWRQVCGQPRPGLTIAPPEGSSSWSVLHGRLSFEYAGQIFAAADPQGVVADEESRTILRRDRESERAAFDQLRALGLELGGQGPGQDHDVEFSSKLLPRVVAELTSKGWHVEAAGRRIRRPGEFKISVSSGVDWFELDARADFEGISVALPELLAAARRGDNFVELGDGSHGMLPEEWLARYGPFAEMGKVQGDKVRFVLSQATLLDALLASQPHVDLDAGFQRLRDKLHRFEGIRPREQPASFTGQLREYQREGLGWLSFLEEYGLGGCLADDMGLGKTIQILALLLGRRGKSGPSLVVVPRSLVYNWIEEARRFAPALRVLDYTGLARDTLREQFDESDLVVTTYGTLRRDIGKLRDFEFDYAILDEAQAIKNSASQAAKACRLLDARHRLAVTGTPVENHLSELWSIFEFLNPGMLGRSQALRAFSNSRQPASNEAVELLAKALRPYLLRRTKEQVLRELPDKTEQTLYCELQGRQRRLYDELRAHYREALMQRVEREGLQKSKIHVLEALLRLRQAACHPGLIDKSKAKEPSAKLETLLAQLREIIDEGHKALVFSQFTSLLALVRQQLDVEQVTYEYLDGKTRDRRERVERFQQDPACPVFLISLKAGGQGLNLTAADYVFILDPWWNPAVEAQAVDRAHRLGQERRVFAYRLIARDTVEEKILSLQGDKRRLAEAIISADSNLLASLTADDVRLLLS